MPITTRLLLKLTLLAALGVACMIKLYTVLQPN